MSSQRKLLTFNAARGAVIPDLRLVAVPLTILSRLSPPFCASKPSSTAAPLANGESALMALFVLFAPF